MLLGSKKSKSSKNKTSSKKKKSSKGSKKSSKSKRKGKHPTNTFLNPPDTSIWVDFLNIYEYLEEVYLFLKPSQFKFRAKVTDVGPTPVFNKKNGSKSGDSKKEKSKKTNEDPSVKVVPCTRNISMEKDLNNPVVIMMDSMDTKFFVINIQQVGFEEMLSFGKIPPNLSPPEELDVCLDRACPNIPYPDVPKFRTFDYKLKFPVLTVSIQLYSWEQPLITKSMLNVNTCGNRTHILEFPPGRIVLRLTAESKKPFVINIMSDSEVHIGRMEWLFELLTCDCTLLIRLYDRVSSRFGRLVQAFGKFFLLFRFISHVLITSGVSQGYHIAP